MDRMSRIGLGVLVATLLVAVASQLLAVLPASPAPTPAAAGSGAWIDLDVAGSDRPSGGVQLGRIRADVAFWRERALARPGDFVSATEWALAEVDLARATDDLDAWRRADEAAQLALHVVPDHPPAAAARGRALLARHRFEDARDLAREVLAVQPLDAAALATLGDASIDLGDYAAAAGAYEELDRTARSAASRARLARLAWVDGRVDDALALAADAIERAVAEGAVGERLAWHHLALAELRASTGDAAGARSDVASALAADAASWQARSLLARLDAAAGRLDEAIQLLDEAIAVVPRPELLGRRADLLRLRNFPGDDGRASDDLATMAAIASLAGDAVHDRTLALYLADHGLEPDRAVALARAELNVRRDVGGHDALAWALLAADRAVEAQAAMDEALALGTRNPRLLYHAGMIAAELGEVTTAAALLQDALAWDAAFDPIQAARARATLEALR